MAPGRAWNFWSDQKYCTRTLKNLETQKWKSGLFRCPKRRFDTFFDPKGSNFDFLPRLHRQIDEKKILQKKIFSLPNHWKTPMKIFLDTYLESRKWHFWGAWKTLIAGTLWAQNSPIGVIDCAESEFDVKNCISPLFGVVRDLENRQKSGFSKLGQNGQFSHFRLMGVICKCPNGCRIAGKHVIISF